MKKIIFVCALLASLCWQSGNCAVDVKASEDSLSRELGDLIGSSFASEYFRTGANAKLSKDDFLKGFDVMMNADTANVSYMNGLSFGLTVLNQIRQMKSEQKLELNKELISQALRAAFNKDNVKPDEKMRTLNDKLMSDMERVSKLAKDNDPVALANKKAGEDYIAKTMKADKKYKVTKSGLVYKVVQKGSDVLFKSGDVVRMKYKGSHLDGKVFDESKDTTDMEIDRVVPGFSEALKLMSPGSKLIAVIPPTLGYGVEGAGKGVIAPNETLVFELEAYGVKVKKDEPKGKKPAPNGGEDQQGPQGPMDGPNGGMPGPPQGN